MSALIAGIVVATLLPATGQITGKTFTLCEKDSHDYEAGVDNPPRGFSRGDTFIFAEPEFDKAGNRVGKSFGMGTLLKRLKRDGIVQFNVSIHLRRGDLELQTTIHFREFGGGHSVAVVGGTGKYSNATGVVRTYNRPCAGVSKKGDHLKVILN